MGRIVGTRRQSTDYLGLSVIVNCDRLSSDFSSIMSDFTQEGALNTTGLVLPKASVRRIMKINDEVGNISAVNFLNLCFSLLTFYYSLGCGGCRDKGRRIISITIG